MEPRAEDETAKPKWLTLPEFLVYVANRVQKCDPRLAHDCRNYAMRAMAEDQLRELAIPFPVEPKK